MTRSRRRRSTCWHEGEEEEVDDDDGTEEEEDAFHKNYKGESSSSEIVNGSASCGIWLSLSLPLAPRSTPGHTGSKSADAAATGRALTGGPGLMRCTGGGRAGGVGVDGHAAGGGGVGGRHITGAGGGGTIRRHNTGRGGGGGGGR